MRYFANLSALTLFSNKFLWSATSRPFLRIFLTSSLTFLSNFSPHLASNPVGRGGPSPSYALVSMPTSANVTFVTSMSYYQRTSPAATYRRNAITIQTVTCFPRKVRFSLFASNETNCPRSSHQVTLWMDRYAICYTIHTMIHHMRTTSLLAGYTFQILLSSWISTE